MAEFCKDCANRLGMRPDSKPLLCEGCGKYFEKKSFWSFLFNNKKALNEEGSNQVIH
ncbi:hypothetical protein [Tenacibaculum sp. C7A-26P2]|uniref:hypothetical protein n=1 Tax=Tenacibaculum sp. C7A-26P2 TaxID=3447504 RepID=UPI003F82EFAC